MHALFRTATSPAASMVSYSSPELDPRIAGRQHGLPFSATPQALNLIGASISSQGLNPSSPETACNVSPDSAAFASPFMADVAQNQTAGGNDIAWGESTYAPTQSPVALAAGNTAGVCQALGSDKGVICELRETCSPRPCQASTGGCAAAGSCAPVWLRRCGGEYGHMVLSCRELACMVGHCLLKNRS